MKTIKEIREALDRVRGGLDVSGSQFFEVHDEDLPLLEAAIDELEANRKSVVSVGEAREKIFRMEHFLSVYFGAGFPDTVPLAFKALGALSQRYPEATTLEQAIDMLFKESR